MFDAYNILFGIGLNFIPLITCEFDKYIDLLAIKVYHYIIILFPCPFFWCLQGWFVYSKYYSPFILGIAHIYSQSSLFNFVNGVF